MTTRDTQTVRYDPENRPVRVDVAGEAVCRFAYDGDGSRRKRRDNVGTIHYVGFGYERNLGNGANPTEVITKYYSASFGSISRAIALRRADTLYFVGSDHLGSTIRAADSSFLAVDGMRYKPYGESRDIGSSLQTDHKFTSQIEDSSIGLYWYGSRAYDAALGRFLIPDTIVPDPGNPQAINRYSYALNNPLQYIDPSGHDPISDLISGIAGWFNDEWKKAFSDEHNGAVPDEADYLFRLFSMADASGLDLGLEIPDEVGFKNQSSNSGGDSFSGWDNLADYCTPWADLSWITNLTYKKINIRFNPYDATKYFKIVNTGIKVDNGFARYIQVHFGRADRLGGEAWHVSADIGWFKDVMAKFQNHASRMEAITGSFDKATAPIKELGGQAQFALAVAAPVAEAIVTRLATCIIPRYVIEKTLNPYYSEEMQL
jgi:RHS repeat-associated protein